MKFRSEIFRITPVVLLVATFWCRLHHHYTISDWKVPTDVLDGLV
jgi:hypothetical protein